MIAAAIQMSTSKYRILFKSQRRLYENRRCHTSNSYALSHILRPPDNLTVKRTDFDERHSFQNQSWFGDVRSTGLLRLHESTGLPELREVNAWDAQQAGS
jgi:hypothetical protein